MVARRAETVEIFGVTSILRLACVEESQLCRAAGSGLLTVGQSVGGAQRCLRTTAESVAQNSVSVVVGAGGVGDLLGLDARA